MKIILLASAVTLAVSGFAVAATPSGDADHAAHHPPVAAAKEDTAKADQQMKEMRDMHAKMLAAKNPEERAALMDEHMKAMQGGIAMMGSMTDKGGMRDGKGMGSMHSMMTRRMDMMEMMMQMMMDREGMRSPATK